MSTGPTATVRQEVLARDNDSCVSCGHSVYGRAYSIHHRIPRGAGGSNDPRLNIPSNLITLCGTGTTGCHGWAESYRAQAREWGYLVYRSLNPAHVPVLTPTGWRFFKGDGSIQDVVAKKREDRVAHRAAADEALAVRTGKAA